MDELCGWTAMYCKADFLRTLTPVISGLWMPVSKRTDIHSFGFKTSGSASKSLIHEHPNIHGWNIFGIIYMALLIRTQILLFFWGVSCNLWSTNLASWEASGSCQLDVHGQVGSRQGICLHEGFEGPKRTRKKMDDSVEMVCQREPFIDDHVC